MYKQIKTYLLLVAAVILTVYTLIYSNSTVASEYVEEETYTPIHQEVNNSGFAFEDLALNFSTPIHPVKAIKPETVVSHASERTRILFHLLSLSVLYFVFKSKSQRFVTVRNYCKSYSILIPIFIFCRKLVI
ncbi:hypothetical protein ACFPQ1_24755 [Rhodocytophaga aerolata]|uniref:hypothetical protein n=1 Tax=Rhodocytophaga aerolata TaxID=455078 RepID=UPI00265CB258|nr:hypothetical protein [Rhodocytophaga aerolata]